MAEPPRIAVVGSVNLDIVARVPRFPAPGETLTGATVRRFPGGKGANQALAARRLGAAVHMVACVGGDAAADEALAQLAAEGVDLSCCLRLAGVNTGLALILVDDGGENQIVVAPGANAEFSPDRLQLPACDTVIAQLEIPMDTLISAASRHTGFFCLNAAPARPVAPELLAHTDLLVVNRIEAEAMGSSLDACTGWLAVTYGSGGAELKRRGTRVARSASPAVEAVDSTGAGDAFTAALCVGLLEGRQPREALRRACAAGAWVAATPGAQASPTTGQLESLLADQ